MEKTCFIIMPFKNAFDDVFEVIEKAATCVGLTPKRSDLQPGPGNIMQQVLRGISLADVVVADITDHNPNVFYELAWAHQVKGPDRVVILAQSSDPRVFDIGQFRHLHYTNNALGRELLARDLPTALNEALSATAEQEFSRVVRGRLQRTRLITKDLRRLTTDGERARDLSSIRIRVVAGLSSLAISDKEPLDSSGDPTYVEALRQERDALRSALLGGARLEAVLNPPRRFMPSMQPARLRIRYERLLGLLGGESDMSDPSAASDDVAAMARCEFVLSPVPMPNLFIIGNDVAYEGIKRGGSGGFEATVCETDPASVATMIRDFDHLFSESRAEMRRIWPPDGQLRQQLRRYYEEALPLCGV
jgi:hypothetical protein